MSNTRRLLTWPLAVGLLLTIIALLPGAEVSAQSCPPPQPLAISGIAQVLPGTPNALRDLPGLSHSGSTVMEWLEGGTPVIVLEGPVCRDGYNWWRVETVTPLPTVGWTADGDFNGHWLGMSLCPYSPPTRLKPGMLARVTPGEPNSMREGAGSGARIGLIPAGGTFTTIDGPTCGGDGRVWWLVNYNGLVGWTAEGEYNTYWLEPASNAPTPTPTPIPPGSHCPLPPRLQTNTTATVTPGTPNALRNQPGLNHSGSSVIGSLAGGAILTVLNGPTCRDGYNWWYVTAGGQRGWTAEGENGVYWLDPLQCPGGLVSQLAPGMWAQVTPGLPNRLRSAPDEVNGTILGLIPAGSRVRVLNGFHCDNQGRLWWRVMYLGFTVGWTVEGDSSGYWLAPR